MQEDGRKKFIPFFLFPRCFCLTFTARRQKAMETNEKKEKRIEIEKPRRRFTGFPIWVWLLLLAIVVAVYVGITLKYG